MNKIRKYLIHLLGGVTEEDLILYTRYTIRLIGFRSIDALLCFMKNRYGMPADEWCKTVYGYSCEVHDRAKKELQAFLKAKPEWRNGGKW